MRPDDDFAEFEIDLAPIWPADDPRLEPIFLAGPRWFEFEEFERPDPVLVQPAAQPLLVEFEEFVELDPQRAPLEPGELPPAPRRPASGSSLLGSLGVHVLPLAFLIGWSSAPVELAAPIPIQLVIEELAAESETASGTAPQPDASSDTSPPAEPAAKAVADAAVPRPPEPARASQVAATPSPAKPTRQPSPAPVTTAALPRTKPAVPSASPHGAPLAEKSPPRPVSGPAMTRDQYRAYLVTLTRPHLYLLSPSLIGDRRGRTTLSIVVLLDGTVARIAVAQSSGYPDIDARIERIVAAVGRFPPLPPSFAGPSTELLLVLRFPDAIEQ